MYGTGRKGLEDIAGREHDIFDGTIVRQTRDERLRLGSSLTGASGNPCAQRLQALGTAMRSVVHRQRVSRLDQVANHSRSHVSKTNEPYFHGLSSFP